MQPDQPTNLHQCAPAPAHLLIIDDNLDQLRLLVAALRGTTYRVSVATQGDQGYARALVLQPDLILLDVCMPGRSGIAVARQLKANLSTAHIPIIFLSALMDAPERLAGLQAGAVDYIAKPFLIEEVLERVRIHLQLKERNLSIGPNKILKEKPVPGFNSLGLNTENATSTSSATFRKIAVEFISNHLSESSLRVSDVAAHLGVSVPKLNAAFDAAGGLSAFEFIRHERMRRAALMLGQSTLAIVYVAMEVGYANAANFSTEFKKFWGKSPFQFRTHAQRNPDEWRRLMVSRFGREPR